MWEGGGFKIGDDSLCKEICKDLFNKTLDNLIETNW